MTSSDDNVAALCEKLGYSHLCEHAKSVELIPLLEMLDASGRPALIAELAKRLPATKLPERQKLATAIGKECRPPPPLPAPATGPPRVLFLHGYGTCPDIMVSAIAGIKDVMPPGCDIEMLRGFETIDLNHQPTAAAFADPQNAGLERIAQWSESTKNSLHCWCNFREPLGREREERPRSYYSFEHPEKGRLEYSSDASAMKAAADKLLAHVNSNEEGFDVVVGFSQGGEVALLLASRAHELSHAKRRPFRFGIFGAELPLTLCNAPGLSYERARKAPTLPPNAHACFAVMGDEDVDNGAGFAEAVEQYRKLGLNIESCTWEGDHRMPPSGHPCYGAMVQHLFPAQSSTPPAAADDDDDLAALGF